MALRFDNVADQLNVAASLINYDAAYTVIMFFYNLGGGGGFPAMFSINRASGTQGEDGFYVLPGGPIVGFIIRQDTSYDEQSGTITIANNTWYKMMAGRQADGARRAWVSTANGTFGSPEYVWGVSVPARSAPLFMDVGGRFNNSGNWWNGRIAGLKLYDTELTTAEGDLETQQFRPRRFTNLNRWTPMIGPADDASDYSGNNLHWTIEGTLGSEDGPPIPW